MPCSKSLLAKFYLNLRLIYSMELTVLVIAHNQRDVGLARAVSPTNTNFRLNFLLTRLQEALYEGLAV